jgi:hypothetical protein
MGSFFVMLLFAPVVLGLLWAYTSPRPRPERHDIVLTLIRVFLFAAVFGGILAQENYLAHHEPVSRRGFYGGALFLMECVPMLFIIFYRYYREQNRPASQLAKSLGLTRGKDGQAS